MPRKKTNKLHGVVLRMVPQLHWRRIVKCSQVVVKDLGAGGGDKQAVTVSLNMKSGIKMQTAGGLLARDVGILLSLKALRHNETMGDQ